MKQNIDRAVFAFRWSRKGRRKFVDRRILKKLRQNIGAGRQPVRIATMSGEYGKRAGGSEVLQITLVQPGTPRKIADILERFLRTCRNDAFRTGLG